MTGKNLHRLRVDDVTPKDEDDEIEELETMIKKYSMFKKHGWARHPFLKAMSSFSQLLLDPLGGYILALLLARSDVRNVYCLVTGENPQGRVLEALRERHLSIPETTLLVALTSDLSRKDLGLSPETFNKLQSENTAIIHRYLSSPRCAPKPCQTRTSVS